MIQINTYFPQTQEAKRVATRYYEFLKDFEGYVVSTNRSPKTSVLDTDAVIEFETDEGDQFSILTGDISRADLVGAYDDLTVSEASAVAE